VRPDLQKHPNTIVTELTFGRKKIIFTVVYCRFGQTIEQFDNFIEKFQELTSAINSEHPYTSIYVGDFNAHNASWWAEGTTDHAGTELEQLFTSKGLYQLVKQPTFMINNSASCIDLVVTSQPNIFLQCEVHPSIHGNCHHQINFAKISINNPPPKPYKRRLWHYSRANTDFIKRSLNNVDWNANLLARAHDVNLQVSFLTDTVKNVFSNFVPFDDVIVKPREPPWMSRNIKTYYNKYRKVFKQYIENARPNLLKIKVEEMKEHYTNMVSNAISTYHKSLGTKLSNPATGPKAYHSAIKKLLGQSKFTIIPPILNNLTFITESIGKATFFNNFFSTQCTVIQTDSVIPEEPPPAYPHSIENINFTENDILKHIRNLNPNKSHGHDEISIRMIKICDHALTKPLFIIYKNSIEKGTFPNTWKFANVLPFTKRKTLTLPKTTAQSHCYLFLAKYLKGSYLMTYINIFLKTPLSLRNNQDIEKATHQSNNFYPFAMKSLPHLTACHLTRCELYS
jgi:hypothetical protein